MKPSMQFFAVAAGATAADPYQIHIRGPIDRKWDSESWSVTDTERMVMAELGKIPKGTKIHTHINSEGGSVKMAMGIRNAFKTRASDMVIHNAGFMLSAATLIPPKGVRVVSPPGTGWMVHDPSAYPMDAMNAEQAQKFTNAMDAVGDMMAAAYAERTGMSAKEARDMMKAETWMTHEKAIDKGFADDDGDEDEDDERDETMAVAPEIFATFKGIPEEFKRRLEAAKEGTQTEPRSTGSGHPQVQGQPPVTAASTISAKEGGEAGGPTAAKSNQPKEKSMNKIIATLVAAGFSVASDATEDAVLPHINALIDQRNLAKKEADKERRNRIEAHVKGKAAALGLSEELTAKYIEAITKDESVQVLFDALKPVEARPADKPRRGADPAPADIQAQSANRLDEIRKQLVTERDPLKISALAKEARELRGDKGMFDRKPSTKELVA